MSFDIFLRSFARGAAAKGDPAAAFRVLEPYFAGDPAGGFADVSTPDGDAEVYGLGGDGLMITHASVSSYGRSLVDVAVAGDYVIMPVGCAVCVVHQEMMDQLPEVLRDRAVVVRSGSDVLSVVSST